MEEGWRREEKGSEICSCETHSPHFTLLHCYYCVPTGRGTPFPANTTYGP